MLGIKLALLIAILVAGAIGAALPLRRRETAGRERLLGWGNAFAAGVFLAAGLVHMLPDADRTWTALGHEYPTAFALAGLAFVLMLLVEHVLLPEQAHEEMHAPSGERFARIAERHRHSGDALAAYAVLIALSIHSLLAGLALGAEAELSRALVLILTRALLIAAAGGLILVLAQSPLIWAVLAMARGS
ncbi:MAG: ZIP family metal transporter, partial [Myxococcota bacterium]